MGIFGNPKVSLLPLLPFPCLILNCFDSILPLSPSCYLFPFPCSVILLRDVPPDPDPVHEQQDIVMRTLLSESACNSDYADAREAQDDDVIISMWTQPFPARSSDGVEVLLYVLEMSEVPGDSQRTREVLFTLTLLLSSFVVCNIRGGLSRDVLNSFWLDVSNFRRSIRTDLDGADGYDDDLDLSEIMPKLLWILSGTSVNRRGEEASKVLSSKQYMERAFEEFDVCLKRDARSERAQGGLCHLFPDRDCFHVEKNMLSESILTEMSDNSTDSISSLNDIVKKLGVLRDKILLNAEIKRISGCIVTGTLFVSLAEYYISMLNSCNTIRHMSASRDAIDVYKTWTSGLQKQNVNRYKLQLEEKLKTLFERVSAENAKMCEQKSLKIINELYRELEEKIHSNVYQDFGEYDRDRRRFFELAPKHPSALVVIHEFMEDAVCSVAKRQEFESEQQKLEVSEIKHRAEMLEKSLHESQRREKEAREKLAKEKQVHATELEEIGQVQSRVLKETLLECEEIKRMKSETDLQLTHAMEKIEELTEWKQMNNSSVVWQTLDSRRSQSLETMLHISSLFDTSCFSPPPRPRAVQEDKTASALNQTCNSTDKWASNVVAARDLQGQLESVGEQLLNLRMLLSQDRKKTQDVVASKFENPRSSDDEIQWFTPLKIERAAEEETPRASSQRGRGDAGREEQQGACRLQMSALQEDEIQPDGETAVQEEESRRQEEVHQQEEEVHQQEKKEEVLESSAPYPEQHRQEHEAANNLRQDAPAPAEGPRAQVSHADQQAAAASSPSPASTALAAHSIPSDPTRQTPRAATQATPSFDRSADNLSYILHSPEISSSPAPPVRGSSSPAPPVRVSSPPAPPVRGSSSPAPPVQVSSSPAPPVRGSSSPAPPVQSSSSPAPPVQVSSSPAPPVQVSSSPAPPVQVSSSPAPPVQVSSPPAPPVRVSSPPAEALQELLFARIETLERSLADLQQVSAEPPADMSNLVVGCRVDQSVDHFENGKRLTKYRTSVLLANGQIFTLEKRYSEFLELYNKLTVMYPQVPMPAVAKELFGGMRSSTWFHRFDPDLIECRKVWLNEFMSTLIKLPMISTSRILHGFLSTINFINSPKKVFNVSGDPPNHAEGGSQPSSGKRERPSSGGRGGDKVDGMSKQKAQDSGDERSLSKDWVLVHVNKKAPAMQDKSAASALRERNMQQQQQQQQRQGENGFDRGTE
ncbi:hypothetical protein GUITHDRAFT_138454 [Guillardia theta CCMP2712]|uniref:PX domain-containing protein n=3 Tax=Guillardia theta TaxID=55529 RepID=L1JBS0_GUITC|nr:hypothetical protein GUITHDRAFT_138454 [Guillardia theta CCMP2712]EKX45961.1 hypothetical protein GUITHDRAFT_138454 [Guillardia theta CCMP2712]|eukprot:XP_005832941.1 hypothetical protein GUITHDRAFT_138454 [Guillardia theta CCMP2712]